MKIQWFLYMPISEWDWTKKASKMMYFTTFQLSKWKRESFKYGSLNRRSVNKSFKKTFCFLHKCKTAAIITTKAKWMQKLKIAHFIL